jgi:hypothetical protein
MTRKGRTANGNPFNFFGFVKPTRRETFRKTFRPIVEALETRLAPASANLPITGPLVAALSVTPAQLVSNGGFETGDFTGWTLSGDTTAGLSNVITGTPDGTTIYSGMHAGQFGTDDLAYLTQTLATAPGGRYNLDFWLSNPTGRTPTEWLVRVGGNTLMDVQNAPRFNYTHYSFAFTATGSSTALQFGFINSPDWFYLDDVSVTPAGVTAGAAFPLTVTALDAAGQPVAYAGTVHFTSSDAQAGLPTDYTFTVSDNGQHTFPVTLRTAGPQTVTVADTVNSQLTASASQVVSPAAASSLVVSGFPSPTTAGVSGSVFVTAYDPYGNVATGYRGTVHLSSSDGQAVLEGDHTFTAADNGRYGFGVTLKTAGGQSITATDTANASIAGTQSDIVVNRASAAQFVFTNPSTVTAGNPFAITVTVEDAYGNPVTDYTGMAQFTTSNGAMASYTFTSADMGSRTAIIRLVQAGPLTVTGTDADTGASGTTSIVVNPAAASSLTIAAVPSPVGAGSAITVTVTALDPYGNVATGYGGNVHFTSSDPRASLPADSMLTNGSGTFTASLITLGSQTITATDTVSSSFTATAAVTVTPWAARYFVVAGLPSPAHRGQAYSFMVTVYDAYGNVATGYRGTITFSSDESHADLPADYTFTAGDAGRHTFAATFNRFGTFYLQATDQSDSSISGEEDGIVVTQ